MTGSQATITTRVCERIVACGAQPLTGKVLLAAKQLFLDGIAVAVAGARLEEAPRLLFENHADPLTGSGASEKATLLGLNARVGTIAAALINGASMHVLDFEPMWLPATHALSPALAPALALGETLGAGGMKILTAMVLGIEIQGRLRAASNSVKSGDLRFHPPGFLGPVGAAVAAGHLLDFDAAQFANAIGIAGSRCGGMFANLGTMTKATHCGHAAGLGLEAALLAKRGFTGTPSLFDPSPQSYAEAFYPQGFLAEGLLQFGQPFRMEDPGYAIKMFPAKFSTHYAITAALQARSRIPQVSDIRRIRIRAAAVPSSDRPHPRSGLDGKFSLQYTTAVTLLDGQLNFDSFTDERLARADVQAMLKKIETTLPADIPSLYTAGRYLDLDIELQDGQSIHERCERPRGAWGAPPITVEEHEQKARYCLATYLQPEAADTFIDLSEQVDTLDPAGIRRLLHLAGTGEDMHAGSAKESDVEDTNRI